MWRLIAFVVVFGFAPHARADANADVAEKIVRLIERAAAISETNKNNCDAMGDGFNKLIDDNVQVLADAKARGDSLSAAEKQAMQQRYKARLETAMRRARPNIMACMSNAKVAGAINRLKTAF